MSRVKRGVTSHAKHKKVLTRAKGFYGRRKNTIRTAKAAVDKAGAIRLPRPQEPQALLPRPVDPAHQRRRPRARPDLWPIYHGLGKAGVEIDRKVLAELAVSEPASFKTLVDKAAGALAA